MIKPRLCCIEPSGTTRLVLLEFARKHGWDIDTCADLPEAEAILASRRVDLVTTAAFLPSGRFQEVVSRLRARAATEMTPIALLIDAADPRLAKKALASGITRVFHTDDLGALAVYLKTLGSTMAPNVPTGKPAPLLQGEHFPLQQALVSHVLDSLRDGLMLVDANGVILLVNPAFSEITGYSAAEAIGQTTKLLRSELQPQGFFKNMFEHLAADGSWSGTLWARSKAGEVFLAQLDVRRLAADMPMDAHYVAVFADITERHKEIELTQHSALHDSLTGLANRILLKDRAQQEVARAQRTGRVICFVFIDLDGFKPINDLHGHEAGDYVLKKVAGRLKAALRSNDTLARFGGDEFVALMPDIADRPSALVLTSKLLGAFRTPIEVNGHPCDLGASIGISLYPDDGRTFDELVARADMAMYRAKEAGGHAVQFYDESMTRSAGDLMALRTRLHSALGKGEFEILFQPQVHLASHRITGAEALLRWRDPERGLLAAAEFIPLAEKTGLIVQIGNWVLLEACHALRRIHEAGRADFRMSVNISPLQLVRGDDFVGDVGAALAVTGAPAEGLRLEVTDSVFLRDPLRVVQILNQLTRRGVSLALDNFGSGYSSLGYLKDMPFDSIKIDRQYTYDVQQDRYNSSVVRAAMNLAGGLDMTVVAEGVETCQQLAFLADVGCHYGQGNLLGRPIAEAQLLDLMADYVIPCPVAA